MNWYYVEHGQQAGPVDDAKLEELVQSGLIAPDTLVWREGWPEWKPYSEAGQSGSSVPPIAGPAPADSQGGVVCAECGRAFSPSDVIRFQDKWVCATCKPSSLCGSGGR